MPVPLFAPVNVALYEPGGNVTRTAASLLPAVSANAPTLLATDASEAFQSSLLATTAPVDAFTISSFGSASVPATPKLASVGPTPRINIRRGWEPRITKPANKAFA